jgi:catechol 2,3-dioxygenase-like lactoylglutathione lyase family enzyme
MELNHLLVPCKDKIESANYFARLMGLPTGNVGHFAPVKITDGLVLDFAEIDDVDLWSKEDGHFARQHYAFKVSEAEFDEIFGRIRERGLPYWADPFKRRPGEFNTNDGGRGVYWEDPSGHFLEIITRPYGSGG